MEDMSMDTKLYLDVEGVLLDRVIDERGRKRGFRVVNGAPEFLSCAALECECFWLTRMDRRGGDYRIRRAFRLALGIPRIEGDLEILFECITPTYWDEVPAEAIDSSGDFYWITSNPDPETEAHLAKLGRRDRLIRFRRDRSNEEFALIQLRLGLVSE